jgi:multisubunit Na+/H+ antiporter MnhC subunit
MTGGGRFGACKALLTYDFSFTPVTSSTVQTVVALAPVQDTSFTSYWAKLFTTMRMEKAEVQFDMTEFINSVGHDFALSPVVIGFAPTAFATTQYYADVSDYKNTKFAAYSTARPVVKFRVPKKWILGWQTGAEASNVGSYFGKWGSTQYTTAALCAGFVHFASQKAMFDTERIVVGRLRMWMEFKGQL